MTFNLDIEEVYVGTVYATNVEDFNLYVLECSMIILHDVSKELRQLQGTCTCISRKNENS